MEVEEQKKYWQVYTDCWRFMKEHLAKSDELQKDVAKDTESIFQKHGNSRFVNEMVNAMRKELDSATIHGLKEKQETYKRLYTDAWLFFRKYSDIERGDYDRWITLAEEMDEFVNITYESTAQLACDVQLATVNELENVACGTPWKEQTVPEVLK